MHARYYWRTGRSRSLPPRSGFDQSLLAFAPVHPGVWNASDEALVAGLAVRDQDVALVFVRRFQARVFGLALSITRDRLAAEEVAQDAFMRAWRYAAGFDPRRGTAAAWLLTITRNAAVDHVRARQRRLDGTELASLETLTDLAGDDRGATARAEVADMAGAVRALPIEQREVLIAAAYLGYTASEISEAWDVPLGTVKTRLRLAVHKLRNAIGEMTS